jgi:TPR repeat protein
MAMAMRGQDAVCDALEHAQPSLPRTNPTKVRQRPRIGAPLHCRIGKICTLPSGRTDAIPIRPLSGIQGGFVRFAASVFSLLVLAFQALPAHSSEASAEDLFQRLGVQAQKGHPEAVYNLGMFLNNGIGTPHDNKAAFRLFQQAASAGHLLAAYKVGCYHAGQFPGAAPENEDLALTFKLRAADAGYDMAQSDVGVHHAKHGDMLQAAAWWEKASRQYNMAATDYLAHALAREGSPDLVKGYALLLILSARAPISPPALTARIAELKSTLGASDQNAAERLRSSWFTGMTPLSSQARNGLAAVPALLDALER